MKSEFIYLLILIINNLIVISISDEHDHTVCIIIYVVHSFYQSIYQFIYDQYEDNEEVVLWMNTVGPYHNRQETYSYFSLPFCSGTKKGISHYHETLGEALQGVELEFSGLNIDFKGFNFFFNYLSFKNFQLF